jgi:hypothetical protein
MLRRKMTGSIFILHASIAFTLSFALAGCESSGNRSVAVAGPSTFNVSTQVSITSGRKSVPSESDIHSLAGSSRLPDGLKAVSPSDTKYVILGLSSIEFSPGKPKIVGIQVDSAMRHATATAPSSWKRSAMRILR